MNKESFNVAQLEYFHLAPEDLSDPVNDVLNQQRTTGMPVKTVLRISDTTGKLTKLAVEHERAHEEFLTKLRELDTIPLSDRNKESARFSDLCKGADAALRRSCQLREKAMGLSRQLVKREVRSGRMITQEGNGFEFTPVSPLDRKSLIEKSKTARDLWIFIFGRSPENQTLGNVIAKLM